MEKLTKTLTTRLRKEYIAQGQDIAIVNIVKTWLHCKVVFKTSHNVCTENLVSKIV